MAGRSKYTKPEPGFHYQLIKLHQGKYYLRIVENVTNERIKHISTGESDHEKAQSGAQKIYQNLDLDKLYRDYRRNRNPRLQSYSCDDLSPEDAYTISTLKLMDTGEYVQAFWDPKTSLYIQDKIQMGTPLSGAYIKAAQRTAKIVNEDKVLSGLPIKDLEYVHIEEFVRRLVRQRKSHYVIRNIIDHFRRAVRWGTIRKICQEISFETLPIPAPHGIHRGILTDQEVKKVMKLVTIPFWLDSDGKKHISIQQRPRLKGGKHNEGLHPEVYFREKLYVMLGLFLGTRRGELRALKWKHIDLENDLIAITENVVPFETSVKEPKAHSARTIVIPDILQPIFYEAIEIAKSLGTFTPESYVILNSKDFNAPVGESIGDAWSHVLRAIGISEEEQKARHLVYHGTRHFYVTKLLGAGLSTYEAGKLSGHRVAKTVERYGDHVNIEILEKGKEALRLNL